jgi:hypothetical protein
VENNALIVTLIIPSKRGLEKIAMSLVQRLATNMGLSQKKSFGLKNGSC